MPIVVTTEMFKDKLAKDKTGQRAIDMFVDVIQLYIDEEEDDRSFSDLMDWAYPYLSCEEATKLALKAKSLAGCHEILMRASDKGQKGRRPKKRIPAIKALVYRQYLRWNWPKVTDRFCPCGKPPHNSSCQESLRSEVVILKRLLRKYDISFP